jgi:hypothetical protein
MRNAKSVSRRVFLAIAVVIAECWLASPLQLNAQNTCSGSEAQNGVYNPTCNNNNPGVVGSSAFIDASMYLPPHSTQARDICDAVFGIFNGLYGNTYPAKGAVIDARGVSGATNLSCTHGTPWTEGSTTANVPSTILMPAGTIQISTTWVLPSYTRLIGEGENNPLSFAPGTTVQAPSGTLLSTMIQFGSSSVCGSGGCSGISAERFTLDGQAQAVNGIVNQFSQNNTYVDHVTIYQILAGC